MTNTIKKLLCILISFCCVTSVFGCSSEEESTQTLENEESSSEDQALEYIAAIFKPVFDQYETETLIEIQDVLQFTEDIGVYVPWNTIDTIHDLEIDVKQIVVLGKSNEYYDRAAITVFPSSSDAEKYYYRCFVYGSEMDSVAMATYVVRYSVVRVGNVIIAGHHPVLVPFVQKYVPDFTPETTYAEKNRAEEYKGEIDIKKISEYMSELGYTRFDSHVQDGINSTSWYGFVNFETNDFCYIRHENSDLKLDVAAKALTKIIHVKHGTSILYTEDCLLVSNINFWKDVLSKIQESETV